MVSLFLSFVLMFGEHNHSPPLESIIDSAIESSQPNPKFDIRGKQRTCAARAIWHEAKGEGFMGQLYVAQTIINRTKHSGFKDDICGVVYEPKQFSWVKQLPKKKHKIVAENKIEKQAYSQLHSVIETVTMLNKFNIDVTNGAIYYHSIKIRKPRGWYDAINPETVEGHIFYKSRKERTEW